MGRKLMPSRITLNQEADISGLVTGFELGQNFEKIVKNQSFHTYN
jgi:hypothetical protein